MAYDYSDLFVKIDSWVQESLIEGWIDQQQALSLIIKPEVSANELFAGNHDRPLVVAFMGGTGVGKSSLLNKLSGQAIARTGVERPTSREVTLYHHQNVSLQQLQQTFPLQDIQISQHSDVLNERVVWVDMPDFDSTEEKNKDIVMQWLPYVDVLVYVVSPERYRDNKAWQLLLAEGASHAWLFVINQWDRGETAQFEDFKQQLAKAGFSNPIIYKTICHADAILEQDELPELQESIASLAATNAIEQLDRRGVKHRNNAIKLKLQDCLQQIGSSQSFSVVVKGQQSQWIVTRSQLIEGFEWPIKQLSIVYSQKGGMVTQDKIKLWDEWAQSRFNDYLDGLVLNVDQQGLPSTPLRKYLLNCRNKAEGYIQTQTELSCRKSLINPGNIVQRISLKIVKIAEVLFPLIAIAVVEFQVFQGYYDSTVTEQAFLGVDFAVHSTLLVLISWLLPFFIRKKMQPSLEKAAFKGLKNGLEAAMLLIDVDVNEAMNEFKQQHQAITESLTELANCCDQLDASNNSNIENERLERMLVKE